MVYRHPRVYVTQFRKLPFGVPYCSFQGGSPFSVLSLKATRNARITGFSTTVGATLNVISDVSTLVVRVPRNMMRGILG